MTYQAWAFLLCPAPAPVAPRTPLAPATSQDGDKLHSSFLFTSATWASCELFMCPRSLRPQGLCTCCCLLGVLFLTPPPSSNTIHPSGSCSACGPHESLPCPPRLGQTSLHSPAESQFPICCHNSVHTSLSHQPPS